MAGSDVDDETEREINEAGSTAIGRVQAGLLVGFWQELAEGGVPKSLARELTLMCARANYGENDRCCGLDDEDD